ncbi:2Fe-2S iron-sulfur cluster-binding protein [Sphingobium cloacae]|uniref:2Fe-2S ferredoxin n=1 Tax=Sphingobium cloacae TaxID=120107 RepID=A0A1E1F1S3_9SPHN|nr:2Fe-2S iron-sulfur cluster-binding protein [Sphingobium cloacae]BAV64456.1 2Fe-2S ferredoxin [Sphingobium cloacae]
MTTVTYIEANGTEHRVIVPAGVSAMEAGRNNGVPGIGGDCGGQAACASCHVFVDDVWLGRTGKAHPETELGLLALSDDFRESSRLACQIELTDELDGLVLQMPERPC